MNYVITLLALCSSWSALGYTVTQTKKELSPTQREIIVQFSLKPDEYLYKESIVPSINTPSITLSELTSSSEPVTFFDEKYKKQKEGYTGNITFTTTATRAPTSEIAEADFHMHYLVSSDQRPQEKSLTLTFAVPEKKEVVRPTVPVSSKKEPSTEPVDCEPTQPSLLGNLIRKILNYISVLQERATYTLSSLFKSTGSKAVRGLAALLLGILLSLTPCIYPMIPITIGVLQPSGSQSTTKNFLLALFYTLGISVTFALLGLIAAVTSCIFGELQGNPFLIMPLAAVLIFVGLTMFDFYQLTIPQWLQPKTPAKGGSLRSAFVFGALSGTVASPCSSGGMLLILNYVTHTTSTSIAAYLEGFLLLFIFGVGSSLPLLIIGTFSGALSMLPKAGAWMIEIKKLVGIMLFSMALYHLSHLERLLPWYLFVWVVVLTFVALGIYYFATIKQYDSTGMRRYKNVMGTFLIVVACVIAVNGEKALLEHMFPEEEQQLWSHNYQEALTKARTENKLLFIDIGATYCASCKALDARIFKQQSIQDALALFSILKVEANVHTKAYDTIKEKYGSEIVGYPTYLVVDPRTENVIKKWSIEIDQLSLEGIEVAFKELAQKHRESLPKTVEDTKDVDF